MDTGNLMLVTGETTEDWMSFANTDFVQTPNRSRDRNGSQLKWGTVVFWKWQA